MLTVDSPDTCGFDPVRWRAVLESIQDLCNQDVLPSAGMFVARAGQTMGTYVFGRQTLAGAPSSIREDAIFLVASITKPIVACGALLLLERGRLALDDRVTEFIPEFGQQDKAGVTIRHLLTHTSGLPDMLSNNQELREQHAPVVDFVANTCEVKLDFPSGHRVQYQSMGFAILGEVIARVTGSACPQFLKDEFFDPLEMNDTALGAPDTWFEGPNSRVNRIAELRVPDEQQEMLDWNWNSRYWRQLGVPWGGLLTTPRDLGNFSSMMLNGGQFKGNSILSPASVLAATRNQLTAMKNLPEEERRCKPWGLGWRLNWSGHSANFGDLLGPNSYGHWGATGTVLWIDPDTETLAIFLTTLPQEPRGVHLTRVCNQIAAALL